MHAMTKQFESEDQKMFVRQYTSRPVLIVKTKEGGYIRQSVFTFPDAVLRFGKNLEKERLEHAYKRAALAFRHQLEQTFVVLCDPDRKLSSVGGPVTEGGSRGAGTGGAGLSFRSNFGSRIGKKKRAPPKGKESWSEAKRVRGGRGGRGGGGGRGRGAGSG